MKHLLLLIPFFILNPAFSQFKDEATSNAEMPCFKDYKWGMSSSELKQFIISKGINILEDNAIRARKIDELERQLPDISSQLLEQTMRVEISGLKRELDSDYEEIRTDEKVANEDVFASFTVNKKYGLYQLDLEFKKSISLLPTQFDIKSSIMQSLDEKYGGHSTSPWEGRKQYQWMYYRPHQLFATRALTIVLSDQAPVNENELFPKTVLQYFNLEINDVITKEANAKSMKESEEAKKELLKTL